MDYWLFDCGKIPATVNISRFQGKSGVAEYNFVVRPAEYGSIETQLEWVFAAYQKALDSMGLDMRTAVLRRFFTSDLLNQAAALESHSFSKLCNIDEPCAVSWICQPAVPPVKAALWAYHVHDPGSKLKKAQEGTSLILKRGELSHHWTTGLTCLTESTHYDQTLGIFRNYQAFLRSRDMTLADNVIRTWFFIQNIDAYYKGLVAARKEFFAEHGLTPATHFIASTGIEGSYVDIAARVTMDAYSISGVRSEQIKFLAALDHLSPPHIYGVTFERGTSVSYRDREHIFISGTASIDGQGNILYPGNVKRQLDRTLENVEALLKQGGAGFNDLCVLIVYVRDLSDFDDVRRQLRDRFGDMPIEVVVAPVCRPGWLIEVEGQAIVPASNPELPDF